MPGEARPEIADYILQGIFLARESLTRHSNLEAPGRFDWSLAHAWEETDERCAVQIVNNVVLLEGGGQLVDDEDQKLAATIETTHVVVIQKPGPDQISADLRENLVTFARMACHPFARQRIVSATAEMGYPPLTLPLVTGPTLAPSRDLNEVEADRTNGDSHDTP